MSRVVQLENLFETLAGDWRLIRELQSANALEPSGLCYATASFTPREPSPVLAEDGKLDLAAAELLYQEQGELEVSSSIKFNFSRKYIWRLKTNAQSAEISVWFTKPGTDTLDYLFHKINIDVNKTRPSERATWRELEGTGGHLCVQDFYSSSYIFYLPDHDNAAHTAKRQPFPSFQIIHEVRGPTKDQVITTQFTRSG